MGIYDRHYIREDNRRDGGMGGALGRARRLSVNTWLIIACLAVFVVDGFVEKHSARLVELETRYADGVEAVPEGAVFGQPRPDPAARGVIIRPIYYGDVLIAERREIQLPTVKAWFHFSTASGFFELELWRLITFQFVHANFMHIVFNMIGLFFFGPMVERYLGGKRYLAFYLLCGIFGALMYVLLNIAGVVAEHLGGIRIPGLLFNEVGMPLVGASAGVFGVIMAGAFLAPNATVLLFFVLPMRLVTMAYGLVALAVFLLLTGSSNAGGEAGHLGGAIAGFYFIRRPQHLHGFFDVLGWADPTSHHYRKKRRPGQLADEKRINAILDKINASGLQSLTDKERELLREASRQDR